MSGVNARTHAPLHARQSGSKTVADDGEQTLSKASSKAMPAIHGHALTLTKYRPKGLFTADALQCVALRNTVQPIPCERTLK